MVCLLACALLATTAFRPQAHAAETFNFYGSGSGHGTGMSQWGAFGLALQGLSRGDILEHFYQGTILEQVADEPDFVRVGLTQENEELHLRAIAQGVNLRLGSSTGTVIGTIPKGKTWTISPVSETYEIRDADGILIGGQAWGGPSEHVFATYVETGARVFVQETGRKYGRGHIEFNLYSAEVGPAEDLRLIVELPVDEYLYGVSEMPSSWPQAALEAQADASRTFALRRIDASGQNRPGCNCAVVATTTDQVYAGWDKESGDHGASWTAAVDATSGEVITYGGNLISALFHASSGGYTEHSENVFVTAFDYLRGSCDPGDYAPNNPHTNWVVGPVNPADLTAALAAATGDIGTIEGFSDPLRGVSGRIIEITVNGSSADALITGAELRSALSLPSARVTINRDLSITGEIRTEYDSLLCAPGLATTPVKDVPGGNASAF